MVNDIENEDVADFLKSEELEAILDNLHLEARMVVPNRPVRSGKLITWGKEKNTEEDTATSLTDFSGSSNDVVSLAGNINSGVALMANGSVSTWGNVSPLPDKQEVNFVDQENETLTFMGVW
jgi:hypothetical protein|tara:strand:- start:1423 stop:1788 length:366 start_codon:yes stop_codon:yes gene_type:complete